MRVLQVASSLTGWGGIERYITYLANGMNERGHETSIVCPPGSGLDQRYFGEKKLIGLPTTGKFRYLPDYVRYLREEPFDIIHAHYSKDFVVPMIAARLTHQRKVLMTRHLAIRWYQPKTKIYDALFDHFVGVSDAVRIALVKSGIDKNKTSVAKMGLPALQPSKSRTSIREELSIPENRFVLGFFGRLIIEKGVSVLIDAIKDLPTVTLHIVGDGPLREKLENQSVLQDLQSRVVFHGYRSDVADAMSAMDAIVVPSTWDEAFPAVVLEAMSLGVPVIASRIGGLPEVVVDRSTGLLATKGDVCELRERIEELTQNAALSKRLGEAGKKLQLREYTVQAMAARFEKVYDSIPERRR